MIIKKFIDFTNESSKYRSDSDIESAFDGFKLSDIKFEARNMNFMYKENTFKCDICWEFKEEDEVIGGGTSETCEDFTYNIDNMSFTYSVNNWYPAKTFEKMKKIIADKLKEKYGKNFKYMRDIDFINLNEK